MRDIHNNLNNVIVINSTIYIIIKSMAKKQITVNYVARTNRNDIDHYLTLPDCQISKNKLSNYINYIKNGFDENRVSSLIRVDNNVNSTIRIYRDNVAIFIYIFNNKTKTWNFAFCSIKLSNDVYYNHSGRIKLINSDNYSLIITESDIISISDFVNPNFIKNRNVFGKQAVINYLTFFYNNHQYSCETFISFNISNHIACIKNKNGTAMICQLYSIGKTSTTTNVIPIFYKSKLFIKHSDDYSFKVNSQEAVFSLDEVINVDDAEFLDKFRGIIKPFLVKFKNISLE